MKVTYPGPLEGVHIPAAGISAKRGETIEVDADLGADLVEQGWTQPRVTKADKAATSEED
jgi:hypothetical protein